MTSDSQVQTDSGKHLKYRNLFIHQKNQSNPVKDFHTLEVIEFPETQSQFPFGGRNESLNIVGGNAPEMICIFFCYEIAIEFPETQSFLGCRFDGPGAILSAPAKL